MRIPLYFQRHKEVRTWLFPLFCIKKRGRYMVSLGRSFKLPSHLLQSSPSPYKFKLEDALAHAPTTYTQASSTLLVRSCVLPSVGRSGMPWLYSWDFDMAFWFTSECRDCEQIYISRWTPSQGCQHYFDWSLNNRDCRSCLLYNVRGYVMVVVTLSLVWVIRGSCFASWRNATNNQSSSYSMESSAISTLPTLAPLLSTPFISTKPNKRE